MGRAKTLLHKLEAPHAPGLSNVQLMLQNDDLLPVPPAERKWGALNYLSFWVADSWNVTSYLIASSMITAGLSWGEAWGAVWLGYGLAAIFLVLNAHAGAKLHLVFPANIRYSFGVFGGLWPILNRAVMACIWTGVQSWIGGQSVYLLLVAIWPSTANIPNGIPNSGTDTKHFLGFFLFSLLMLIPVWFPPHQIRHLFTLKAIVAPIAGIAFLVWFVVKAGGVGPIIHQPSTVHGSQKAWQFVIAFMSCLSNMATLITNAQDFASRANKVSSVMLPQLFALPICFALVSFVGIIISSSSSVIYGESIWNPLDLLERVLQDSPTHGDRAGVAFISLSFIVAQLGTNVAANTLSAGCDLTALFPRFMTIRRGGYVACLVSFCMCPWNLLSSSSNFATYLSAYSVFLSSVIGVMLAEYYTISRMRIKLRDLYSTSKSGLYWYCWGVNFRAYAAYLCGIAINVVGFAGAVGAPVPTAATHIYQLSFFTGLGVSFLIYYLLNRLFPVPKATLDDTYDDFADNAREEVRAVYVEEAAMESDKSDLKDDDFYASTRVEEAG